MKSADELREDIIFDVTLCQQDLRFVTTWGLFSPRAIDEGSALLLKHLEVGDADVTLDLGCGYGALGITIAKLSSKGKVLLVDKDFVAVDYVRKNIDVNKLSNCEVLLSNGFSHVPKEFGFDNVVANLPAKVGRELLFILLSDARDRLKPGGKLVVVTINGLRKFIKRNLEEIFGNARKLKQGKSYTITAAVRE